jgi:hypothetical protein
VSASRAPTGTSCAVEKVEKLGGFERLANDSLSEWSDCSTTFAPSSAWLSRSSRSSAQSIDCRPEPGELPANCILALAQTKPREIAESGPGFASDVQDQRAHRRASEHPPFLPPHSLHKSIFLKFLKTMCVGVDELNDM